MNLGPDRPSVDDLNLAQRLTRRLLVRITAIGVLGFVAAILLGQLGTSLSPPYGISIYGEGLGTWAMLLVLVLLIAEFYWDGRGIGRALKDLMTAAMPVVGIMSATTLIAKRANELDMRAGPFFGPLRPARNRSRTG